MALVIGFLLPVVFCITLLQMGDLHAYARERKLPVGWFARLRYAFAGTLCGTATALALGYMVMFGPSHLTGDFIGLPWVTSLPAIVLAFWSFRKVTGSVSQRLLQRAHPHDPLARF